MSSYWTPFSPSRESDYYRPNVTVNIDRPPRPGPRQPDCWRPAQTTASAFVQVKQEESAKNLDIDDKKPKVEPKRPRPTEKVIGLICEETIEAKSELNKQKVNPPKLPNANKEPLGRLRGGFSVRLDDNRRLTPQTNQLLSVRGDKKSAGNPKIDSEAKTHKVKPPKLPNPNLQALGKRQMGVINSIMRVEEQNSKVTQINQVRGEQLTTKAVQPLTTETNKNLEEMVEKWQTDISPADHNPTVVSQNNERPPCRRLPYPRNQPTIDPQRSPTNLSTLLPTASDTNVSPLPSTSSLAPQDSTPTHRRKLDFDNRVDQCLLKMDKWADAWLSNALIDEDPSPEIDNAWNSFEYCLGMPDILEEGEIAEYEEVPRQALPVEVKVTSSNKQTVGMKRKREWDEGEVLEVQKKVVETSNKSWATNHGMMLNLPPMVAQPKNNTLRNASGDGERVFKSLEDDTHWTDTRESRLAEFQSSSPKDTKMKVIHIPSAATLRDEARRRLM